MKITCPKCHQEYDVESSMNGQKVECSCGEKFIAAASLAGCEANTKPTQSQAQTVIVNVPPQKKKMGCFAIGCLGAVILIAIISIIPASKKSPQEIIVAHERATKNLPKDLFEEKYGKSESIFAVNAYEMAKGIVRKHFLLPEWQKFPFNAADDHVKVFEFEKRKGAELIGEWVGVNVLSHVNIDQNGMVSKHEFSGTFHYDPKEDTWYCLDFVIDKNVVLENIKAEKKISPPNPDDAAKLPKTNRQL